MDLTPASLLFCPDCASSMPESAAFCPGCGRSMQVVVRAEGKIGVLPVNIASALAYFTLVPAVLFLVVDPYRQNFFVRFHSLQCLMFSGAVIVLAALLRIASLVLFIIPVLGPLLVTLVDVVAVLAAIFVWLVLVVKAFQGEIFRLPFLGNLAEQYAARH